MKKSELLLKWCALTLLLLPWLGHAGERPNILLIMADDLGYSDLGSYGGEIATPNLDQLAGEGLRMTSFYVAPTCSPTRSMLMSGTDNHLVGLGTMAEVLPFAPHLQGQPGYEGHINDKAHSLPRLLADAGYSTFMSGKWHLGTDPAQDPHRFGFDQAFVLLQGGASHFQPLPGSSVRVENVSYRENGQDVEVPEDFFSTDYYTDRLIDYLQADADSGKPFFAWLAYTAPHWPLHAPDDYIDRYQGRYDEGYEVIRQQRLRRLEERGLIARGFVAAEPAQVPSRRWAELTDEEQAIQARKMEVYAAMVEHMDANIGRLFDYLKGTGRYDNTLIIFVSDNGAAGEDHARGYSPDDALTDNSLSNIGRRGSNVNYGYRWAEVGATPFSLVKGTTAEGGISSPAIVRLPASLNQGEPGRVVEAVARVDDLLPTLLALAGIADPGNQYQGQPRAPITGMSLLPVWTGNSHAESRVLAGEMFAQAYVRAGDWKLRSAHAPDGRVPDLNRPYQWQLFNLAEDRGETHDLAGQYPLKVKELEQLWRQHVERVGIVEPGVQR